MIRTSRCPLSSSIIVDLTHPQVDLTHPQVAITILRAQTSADDGGTSSGGVLTVLVAPLEAGCERGVFFRGLHRGSGGHRFGA
jgi:hypothetical protein